MQTRKRRQPWVAVLLAFVYPGLGHVYLREWGRALLWFVLAVGSVVLLAPAPDTGEATGLGALVRASQQVPVTALLALASVTVFSMFDAYLLAVRRPREQDGASCPHCGREIDGDIDFCHWCTEPIEAPERNA